jgi:hypothetical protein
MHYKKRKLRTGCAPPAGPFNFFFFISGRADLYSALPHHETAADMDHQCTYVARNQTKDRNGAQWTGWFHLTKFTKIQFSSRQDHGGGLATSKRSRNTSRITKGLVPGRIMYFVFISVLQAHRFWVPWNPYPMTTMGAFRRIKASAA